MKVKKYRIIIEEIVDGEAVKLVYEHESTDPSEVGEYFNLTITPEYEEQLTHVGELCPRESPKQIGTHLLIEAYKRTENK